VIGSERRAAAWAAAYHFLLLGGYYVLRPVRDAMGLRGGVKQLPALFVITLAATAICAPLLSFLVGRLPRRRFVPLVYHALAAQLVIFFVLLGDGNNRWAARAFFVWVGVFNLFAVSVFWGFMADRFDAKAAARRFGFIAMGGTLGAMAGAAVTGALVERLGERQLLLIAAGAIELATLSYGRISDGSDPAPHPPRPMLAFAADLVRSRYLLGLAGYLLLYTITSTFAYLEQGRIVSAQVPGDAARAVLFARMDLWVNSIALVLQLVATRALLQWLGTAGTLAILPVFSLAGFACLALLPTLPVLMAFQVGRRALDYAAARPAREACYTVVGRDQKYALKSFIDGFVYRGGDALGAGLFGLLASASTALIWALPVCAAWLVVAFFVGIRQAVLARS
jgi:AAA family ATP:ADP antiporter